MVVHAAVRVVAILAIVVLGAPVGRLLEPGHPSICSRATCPSRSSRSPPSKVATWSRSPCHSCWRGPPPAWCADRRRCLLAWRRRRPWWSKSCCRRRDRGADHSAPTGVRADLHRHPRLRLPVPVLHARHAPGRRRRGRRARTRHPEHPRTRRGRRLARADARALTPRIGLAVAFTVVWMLASVNSDQSIASRIHPCASISASRSTRRSRS